MFDTITMDLDLCKKIAGYYAKKLVSTSGLTYDDLFQEACIGYLQAKERYNPDLHTDFEKYAESRTKGAVLDLLRKSPLVGSTRQEQVMSWHDTESVVEPEVESCERDILEKDEVNKLIYDLVCSRKTAFKRTIAWDYFYRHRTIYEMNRDYNKSVFIIKKEVECAKKYLVNKLKSHGHHITSKLLTHQRDRFPRH